MENICATNDDSDVDISESMITCGISEELIEREKEYRRKNKELKTKSKIVVKQVEDIVEESKQVLKRPMSHPALSAAAEDSHGPNMIEIHQRSQSNNDNLKPHLVHANHEHPQVSDWGNSKANEMPGIETANKFLRTKLLNIQKDLEKSVIDRSKKEGRIVLLENNTKTLEEEKQKMSKTLLTLQSQMEKLKKHNQELKKNQSDAEIELQNIQKELEQAERNKKNVISEASTKDLKLNRAIQDIDKYKGLLAKASLESKQQLESTKETAEKLFNENNKLTKQKQDLLLAFKKQAQLVQVLKRQMIHLEATKILEFSEDEFMKVLNIDG